MLRLACFAIVLTCSGLLFSGCSQSKTAAKNDHSEDSADSTATKNNELESVQSVPSEGNGLVSPAKRESQTRFDPSMDPSSVTSEYLKSLKQAQTQSDNLETANELLTAKALNATNLANVDVSLPGTENSSYVVHQTKYVTNEKNIAHVLTTWNDNVEGQDYEYDVTWVLKKESKLGWRVSGMIYHGEAEGETVVFNFEDPNDIVSKGAPEKNDPAAVDTQTAEKKAETEIR